MDNWSTLKDTLSEPDHVRIHRSIKDTWACFQPAVISESALKECWFAGLFGPNKTLYFGKVLIPQAFFER